MLPDLPHFSEGDASVFGIIITVVIVPLVAWLTKKNADRAKRKVAEQSPSPDGDDSWGYYKALIRVQQSSIDRQGQTIENLVRDVYRAQQTAAAAHELAAAAEAKVSDIKGRLEKFTSAVGRYLAFIYEWARKRGETMPMPPNVADLAELAHVLPEQTLSREDADRVRRDAAHHTEKEDG